MAIALVQSTKTAVSGFNNTTLTYASNLTAGNLLCNAQAHFTGAADSITTPTDTLGHTYVGMVAQQQDGASNTLRSFYKENCSGGTCTVTFDIAGANTGDLTAVIAEFSGAVTAGALDVTASATGSSTTPSSGATAARAQADEMLWGAMTYDGAITGITVGTNFTIVQEQDTGAFMPIGTEYQIVAAGGTDAATWTLAASRAWMCHVATFKAAGGGAPPEIGAQNVRLGLRGPALFRAGSVN